MMQDRNKPLNEIKEVAGEKEKMQNEIDTTWSTDYLDENGKVALKCGCLSIFTPRRVGNLNTICFKIRGLFESEEDLADRIENLKKKYPHDPIQRLDVGLWCVDTDVASLSNEDRLKQLNYAMKCHIDNLATETEEFEKRRENMVSEAENHAKVTSINNKKARRKAKKEALTNKSVAQEQNISPAPKPKSRPSEVHSLNKGKDDKPIKQVMDFLYDEILGENTRQNYKINRMPL